jgi:thioredoxin 2
LLNFRCASCGGWNRVESARVGQSPTCGRCKAALPVDAGPVHADDDLLDALIAKSPVPVLVDFHASWCGPCHVLAPRLDTLSKRLAGRLVVAKVDVDRNRRLAERLQVQSVPTLALYVGGQMVQRTAGALSDSALHQLVAAHVR